MKREDNIYQIYVQILKEELVTAMGCTEPIAISYAAAKARAVLGELPEKIVVKASGSIIKNVKSVVVPNTGGLRGIEAAAAAGVVCGNENKKLEVLSEIESEDIERIKGYLGQADIKVEYQETGHTFDLSVCVYKEHSQASVRITDYHTNIVQIEKNWELIRDDLKDEKIEKANRDVLSMENIWEFVRCADIEDVKETLDKQIECNMKIAREGIRGNYGANIGSVLLKMEGDSVQVRAKAMAAAGSDARMNGCGLPVVINSGSGNQGITCSVPVLVYGESLNCDIEKIYRALLLSNLTAIYIKAGIGTLSAYCGAVSAGAAAGAGIAYLHGGGYEEIKHTVVNALAIVSGIVCDGAKASCAAKIASSVEAGIVGYYMYLNEQEFYAGEGIVAEGIDRTIENIGILGKEGMKETNKKIIEMMIK
ncbi:L-cysteine desulfidase family protein [Coprococcus comes]|uniref:L-cysteine desulfidase family protein n=1 Tax=Coprococcus comes TaxID=410072 RepID=UPI00189F77E0|nr:L-serine ammonia-lyase, iron-sulfur-dependent, subunit alpha [Coprococcus comes]